MVNCIFGVAVLADAAATLAGIIASLCRLTLQAPDHTTISRSDVNSLVCLQLCQSLLFRHVQHVIDAPHLQRRIQVWGNAAVTQWVW
jgi:hypothetical protein